MTWRPADLERMGALAAPFAGPFRAAADDLVAWCAPRGIIVLVTEGVRSLERQRQIYRTGRTKNPSTGLWQVTGRTLTDAAPGQSAHERGLAADVLCVWASTRAPLPDDHEAWREWAAICERHGLTCGGRWPKRDWCHAELPGWREIGGHDAGRT